MGDRKRKERKEGWIWFEDGLNGEFLKDEDLATKNKNAYNEFYKRCCKGKRVIDRRVILIFLGVRSSKKKEQEELLLKSIMRSFNLDKGYDEKEILTVSMVRAECDAPDIINMACMQRHPDTVKKKEINYDNPKKDKEYIKEGSRIVDDKKRTRLEKIILGKQRITDVDRKKEHSYDEISLGILKKNLLKIGINIPLENSIIMKFILNIFSQIVRLARSIYGIIYSVVWDIFRNIIATYAQKVIEEEKKEIDFFRDLDYPVIFYNDTGKTKSWMKSYMKCYIDSRETEESPKTPIFYIEKDDFGIKDENFIRLIIPKEYPEWGLLCLCKLVRDLTDNPWGAINLPSDIKDEKYKEFKRRQRKENREESENLVQRIKIFRMWEEEYDLWLQREMQGNQYWNYAKIYGRENEVSRLFPIGHSVYVLYKNGDVNQDKIFEDIKAIRNEISTAIKIYHIPVDLRYWVIIVDGVDQGIIDALDEANNNAAWDGRHSIWVERWTNIWEMIIWQLIEKENQDNYKLLKTLCNEVWKRYQMYTNASFDEYYSMKHAEMFQKIMKREE